MQLRIVAVLACLCPVVSAQTDTGLWRFVHPNAKALIGINVQRIRTSRVAEEMSSKWNTLSSSLPFQIPGLDLVRSIDRIVISSPGQSSPDSKEEPPVLLAVSGHFEPGKLREMWIKSGMKPQLFNSVTIYRPQGKSNRDFGIAVLNSQTLLLGDSKSLFEVIERVERNPAAAPPSIVEHARDMDLAYDFWAIMLAPPSAMGSDRFPLADMAGKVTGFEAGIALRDGLAVDVKMNAISDKAAKEISAEFSKLAHMAAKDKNSPASSEWAELGRNVKVSVEHSDVHLAVRLQQADLTRLAKALEEAKARREMVAIKDSQTAPTTAPLQSKPPEKMVIRIDGLDEGPREIPYQRSNH